jgi:hypothetical protein
MWQSKAYVPKSLQERIGREAFLASLQEHTRAELAEEDLCQFAWDLAFKDHPGLSPLALPPCMHATLGPSLQLTSYLPSSCHAGSFTSFGTAPLRRFFHADHTVTAPDGDPLEGGESSS